MNVILSVLTEWKPVIDTAAILFIAATFVVYFFQLKAMRTELDQSRIATQTSQYQAALQLMLDWRTDIISKPDLAAELNGNPYFKRVFSVVSPDRYFHTVKVFHIFEYYWLLHTRGIIDKSMWVGWSNNLMLLLRLGKNRILWNELQGAAVFNPNFVAFVNQGLSGPAPQAQPNTTGG